MSRIPKALAKIARKPASSPWPDMCGASIPAINGFGGAIAKGELNIQQMDVQTYFFRRTNMNAAGKPRSWTDHLLWHHACHTVDLFHYQTGETTSDCYAVQGPRHPKLGIAMDMGILLKMPSGAICTLSLSFNNDGPIGSFFRYICDNGTYNAYYDDLADGKKNPIDPRKVDVSMDGIELEDREFIAAIARGANPIPACRRCCPACACSASWNASSIPNANAWCEFIPSPLGAAGRAHSRTQYARYGAPAVRGNSLN